MKIVIIGGGFCGAIVAKKLDKIKEIDKILIDRKPYFEYQPSLHKLISKPNYISKLRIEYLSFLKNTKIVVDEVKKVSEKFIELSDSKIFFDILVISTGIDYPILLDNKKNVHNIKDGEEVLEIARKIKDSNHVLIVGGGVIGVEVAGEIVEKFPDKNLTIVHNHNRLLERFPSDSSEYTLRFLKRKKAEIIFADKVKENKEGIFLTEKGRKISADLCIWCTGIEFNPYFMKNFPKSCFSKKNALNVNEYLKLEGFSNIFVGGDITNIPEEKTARKSKLHAKIIVKNIKRALKKDSLVVYKSGKSPIIISLGDFRGIILYKYVIPGLFIPGLLKWLIQSWFIKTLKI
jgi:apoptosis-inducing factor 2